MVTTLDLRGAAYDFYGVPVHGINHEFQYKIDEDTPRSLENATVTVYIADDEGSGPYHKGKRYGRI